MTELSFMERAQLGAPFSYLSRTERMTFSYTEVMMLGYTFIVFQRKGLIRQIGFDQFELAGIARQLFNDTSVLNDKSITLIL
jgi:hypothetical protein